MSKEREKTNYLNPNLCKECGGECCKQMPGIYSPEDFGTTEETIEKNLTKALETKLLSIDWWEGDPRENICSIDKLRKAYFIRPATKDNKRGLFDPSWGGECVFLTENGCTLQSKDRPYECRMLEPKENECCILHGKDKRKLSIVWIPFNEMIRRIETKITNSKKENKT